MANSFRQNIVVIGASAGGLAALMALVKLLPHPLRATMFVAWHVSSQSRQDFIETLSNACQTAVTLAQDGVPVAAGSIYMAPPGHHLTILNDHLQVLAGPRKRDLYRPSVDPLFHSAADAYGARVIGIVLSGSLDDGTGELATILAKGGLTMVQDPSEAAFPAMPQSALQRVHVDCCQPIAGIAARLIQAGI